MSEDRENLSAEAETLQPAAEERSAKKAKKEKEKKPLWREILEWVLTLLVALMIALPVRIFIFEPVRVDGHSMDDTLANGEIMYVSKTSYGSFWLAMPSRTPGALPSAATRSASTWSSAATPTAAAPTLSSAWWACRATAWPF